MSLGFILTAPEAGGITETTTLELHEKWLQENRDNDDDDVYDGGDDANNPRIAVLLSSRNGVR